MYLAIRGYSSSCTISIHDTYRCIGCSGWSTIYAIVRKYIYISSCATCYSCCIIVCNESVDRNLLLRCLLSTKSIRYGKGYLDFSYRAKVSRFCSCVVIGNSSCTTTHSSCCCSCPSIHCRIGSGCWICTVDSKVGRWCSNRRCSSYIYHISYLGTITLATLRCYQGHPSVIGSLSCFISIYLRVSRSVSCSSCIPLKCVSSRYNRGYQSCHIIVSISRTLCFILYSRCIRFGHYSNSYFLASTFATISSYRSPIPIGSYWYDC